MPHGVLTLADLKFLLTPAAHAFLDEDPQQKDQSGKAVYFEPGLIGKAHIEHMVSHAIRLIFVGEGQGDDPGDVEEKLGFSGDLFFD